MKEGTHPEEVAARAGAPAPLAVVLVGSAGGIGAIGRILDDLPADLHATVVVLLHLLPERPSVLADILRRHTVLVVSQARPGDVLEAGHVYVAPPDEHLVVRPPGVLELVEGPPIHWVRPSADVLLESCAEALDGRVVAVVLSGTGRDGADGVRAVKRQGGTVIAQDEATSEHFGMPSEAIATGSVDRVLPLAEIAPAIVGLAPSPTAP